MKVTFICQGCGALIGSLNLAKIEQDQLDLDSLTAEKKEDIIKNAGGDIFIYSLCEFCACHVTVSMPPDSR